jgi:hypothetical protein
MSKRSELTHDQRLALNALERALIRVAKSGLGLYGQDSTLFAMDDTGKKSPWEAIRDGHAIELRDRHGAYKDSGGA